MEKLSVHTSRQGNAADKAASRQFSAGVPSISQLGLSLKYLRTKDATAGSVTAGSVTPVLSREHPSSLQVDAKGVVVQLHSLINTDVRDMSPPAIDMSVVTDCNHQQAVTIADIVDHAYCHSDKAVFFTG
jgi:hypothetical protein